MAMKFHKHLFCAFVCALLLAPLGGRAVGAEVVALKNNLAYDAVLTPNLELEFVLAPRWTMEIGAGFNPFPLKDTQFPKWRHVSAWVAPRYWFCHAFHRDFISVNAAYAMYNVAGNAWPVAWMYPQVKDSRYEGHAAMAGVSYGWHFAISPHFSVELEGGVDAGYSWFTQYECKHCGAKKAQSGRWLVLPKLGINLVVPLGGNEETFAKRCDCEQLDDKGESTPDTVVVVLPPDTVFVAAEPLPRDTTPVWIPAERILADFGQPQPVSAAVPRLEVRSGRIYPVYRMHRLRNRLLRDEDDYEPYNRNIVLSDDPMNVFLYFDVNETKMNRSFLANDKLMDSIMNIVGDVLADSTLLITRVRIVGFASFDGPQDRNEELAEARATTIKEYMQSVYPLQDSVFTLCNGGESWAELRYQLSRTAFQGRDEVLEIIDQEPDPDQRERLIKRLHNGKTYRFMRDQLRQILRNLGCITIYCTNVE